ncbi:MAG: GNAT family N-acetyltransferase [Syntrophothermus sp.]|uniref:GNAT family N-acetyltransferase n=1 Tax=Syntrophothermus sp. TaxID=2736299 RepID=UPI00257FBDE0|nr:GNAT family N-acetyltransferase [Syntrophothermus sp.]NSW83713.1 GNAT family N-acetyltransferase [Syntrophothermus sp.]
MLVCRVEARGESRERPVLDSELKDLIAFCCSGLETKLELLKNEDSTVVIKSIDHSRSSEEEFYFRFKLEEDSVFLANLKVPASRRREGIGTFCVEWLKGLARALGFKRVVLESYPSAVGFWAKMGFERQQEEEDF